MSFEKRLRNITFSGRTKKIAVVGPSIDSLYNQLGDYTAPQNESECVTVLEGIKNLLPKNWEVLSEKGTEIREELPDGIQRAEVVAKEADAIVMVLGGSSARNFDMEFFK